MALVARWLPRDAGVAARHGTSSLIITEGCRCHRWLLKIYNVPIKSCIITSESPLFSIYIRLGFTQYQVTWPIYAYSLPIVRDPVGCILRSSLIQIDSYWSQLIIIVEEKGFPIINNSIREEALLSHKANTKMTSIPCPTKVKKPQLALLMCMTFANCKRKKMKLGQVLVSWNIAQNHSSGLQEVISGHYLPKFTNKVDQSEIRSSWSRFQHCSASLVSRAHRKSYLVITWPNSHGELTKGEFTSSWSLFEHVQNHSSSP